ncbi:MAG TPA: glycosyl hydrolase family 39 [Bryobacteraceae bacterium]|nr:glycosyl hydrolase family 39 [Bryobacteraceae bacterium]
MLLEPGGQPQSEAVQQVVVDVRAPTRPFPHFWEQVFGSGRAILSLRESYRNDLRAMRAATDIHYVRFHAIFHDEVGVYDEDAQGQPVYNWSSVDQIYDGLLENGVRPFVELSFMPHKLAQSLEPHAFWYKPLPSPPKNYTKWEDLVYRFAAHLVERYGAVEVRQWYFEVWNEPNIDFWTGRPKQATYFDLYDHAARAIKRADPGLRVGGPATAQAAWIDAMIEHSVEASVPLDFISTHVYANDTAENVFGSHEQIPRRDMVGRAVRNVYDQVKASPRPDLPILWTEYNASYKNEIDVTDSAYMGPWLANNIRLCDGLVTSMSYWTFSDVFEEQGVIKTPFYGGYGLIAEGGIPKPAFHAFAMLHRLGDRRLQPDLDDALLTKRADGTFVVAVWNYAPPSGSSVARMIHVRVDGWTGTPGIQVEIVDPGHGSALAAWRAMGSPKYPTREQYERLRRAATATQRLDSPSFILPAHALALVEIQPR